MRKTSDKAICQKGCVPFKVDKRKHISHFIKTGTWTIHGHSTKQTKQNL